MENTQLSVSEFVALTNQTLEYAYPSVMVEGEISSFKVNQGKYVFFDIKDSDASVGCFMTVWQLRLPLEDGMKVVVKASPKLTKWGKFSLTVSAVRPSGEGAIKKSFELLKAKLTNEGLFASERKRTLPPIPSKVAVITSTQAAGYADFVKIVNERWGGLAIDVAHVQVQGDVAPDQIIRAINYFNQQETLSDVLVIIRGGGSAEDLAAFNDEPLVRAVSTSRIPTLIGVGHETDESLAELAADMRASTPSNVAQILVPDKREILRAVRSQVKSLLPRITQAIDQHQEITRSYLVDALNSIERSVDSKLQHIAMLGGVIGQLDPRRALDRGYAFVKGDYKVGSMLTIETQKAIMKAEVKDVVKKINTTKNS